jgi:hypothetical protein
VQAWTRGRVHVYEHVVVGGSADSPRNMIPTSVFDATWFHLATKMSRTRRGIRGGCTHANNREHVTRINAQQRRRHLAWFNEGG